MAFKIMKKGSNTADFHLDEYVSKRTGRKVKAADRTFMYDPVALEKEGKVDATAVIAANQDLCLIWED